MAWNAYFSSASRGSWQPPPPPSPPRLPLPPLSPSPLASISVLPPSPSPPTSILVLPPSPSPSSTISALSSLPSSPPSPEPSPDTFPSLPPLSSFPALHLYPIDDSFIAKRIPLFNNQYIKIGRRERGKTTPTDTNGLFDSKVLSRWHAGVWQEDGKIFIKDTKSWNGTFVNGKRLSPAGVESKPFELKTDDIVDFGHDILDSGKKTVAQYKAHKVSARVVCVFSHQDLARAKQSEAIPPPVSSFPTFPLLPFRPKLRSWRYPAVYLYPINDTFIAKHICLSLGQHIQIGKQTDKETTPSSRNGYFDAKILSRRHAEVWEEGGKIFIKDLQSSNGTFINGKRLSPEGAESDAFELKTDDIIDFGVDIVGMDNKSIVHHKVSARVVCVFNYRDGVAARMEWYQLQQHPGIIGSDSRAERVMNEMETKNDGQIYDGKHSLASLLTSLKFTGTASDMIINEGDLDLVRKLLDSPDDNSIISGMEDPLDAKLFLNFILYLLKHGYLTASGSEDNDQKVQRLLFKLIFKTDAISLTKNDIKPELDLDTAMGHSGRVFRSQHKGQQVALRLSYKIRHENNLRAKNFYRDVLAWRSLCHQHILPLLGIFEVESNFFVVSPLMINGTLTKWRKNQTPDVAEIHKLMREVAEGVQYIHSEGIVHGSLHGENILLDSNFLCQIAGFGLMEHSIATMSDMLNFVAPERFLRNEGGQPDLVEYHYMQEEKTMKTDMYAFGCLYYAIFFDSSPFQEVVKQKIPKLIVDGKRPARYNSPLMDDGTWKIIQSCWIHDASERPTMEQVVQMPTSNGVFVPSLDSLPETLAELKTLGDCLVNKNTLRRMCELLDLPEHSIIQFASEESNNSNVKLLLEFILNLLRAGNLMHCGIQDANRKARKLMLKLISADAMPKSLFITNVKTDLEAIGVGGFARVFTGIYKGQQVALKMLDKIHKERGSLTEDFCREALAWRSLSHRFILPLLGIFESKSQLYLVSPLMKNGTLRDWRKKQTPAVSELHRVMLEAAEGIQYIHSEGIVHGDLHGGNVLLDSELHCQITDFGSTRHSESTVTQSTTALSLSFAAPELFGMCIKCGHLDCEGCYEGYEEYHKSKTMKTDIYAFGCLYYAIFFDTVPFHGSNYLQIMRLLTKGRRPDRLKDPEMADTTWNLIQGCWKPIPSERPDMEQILKILTP